MSRLLNRALVLCVATFGFAGLVQAQYVGPGTSRPPGTLTDLLKAPIDGQGVQLRGRLLQQLNRDKYLFSDGRSQIRVQIASEIFPKQAIDDKTEIDIFGTVEKDFMETPEIDVKRAEVVTPEIPKPASAKR